MHHILDKTFSVYPVLVRASITPALPSIDGSSDIKEIPSLVVGNNKPLVGDYITDWLITQGRNLRKNEKPNSERVNCTEQYMNTLPNCVEDDLVIGYNVDIKQEKVENKVINRKFANFYNKK